jgi:hypothetical protein
LPANRPVQACDQSFGTSRGFERIGGAHAYGEATDNVDFLSMDVTAACACRKLDPVPESGLSSGNAEDRRWHSYSGRDGTTGAAQSRILFLPE